MVEQLAFNQLVVGSIPTGLTNLAECTALMPLPRCLVVDPDQAFAQILAEIIGRHGFETTVIHDPFTALSALRRQTFDLVLFDLSTAADDFAVVFETIRRDIPALLDRIVIVTTNPLVSADLPVGVPVVGKNDLKPLMEYLKTS